jgi:hypothetical protein
MTSGQSTSTHKTDAQKVWHFAVSGDSRNCGDVVMPAIAAGVQRDHAAFYWHLGDFRLIRGIDQDLEQLAKKNGQKPSLEDYKYWAWQDFLENQIAPFGNVPVYLGIGNHETILPKTRSEYIAQFADWLEKPNLQQQRLKDDPKDHRLKPYYHWVEDGVDFINLDNATADQFDSEQMQWFKGVMNRDLKNPTIGTVVLGMHAALPDSISASHSMNESKTATETGREVYLELLQLQAEGHKKVYAMASHSHYFMDGIFKTEYWRTHGGVLPGWIVGTAGAVRYPLAPGYKDANAAETNVYGYLLATVNPPGQPAGTIVFDFKKISGATAETVARFGQDFVSECFDKNSEGK